MKYQPISGPSDVGGSCPAGTNLYKEAEVEYCCCGDGCCWDRCTFQDPPKDNCLPPGAVWQRDGNTGHFRALMGKGSSFMSAEFTLQCLTIISFQGLTSADEIDTAMTKSEIERGIEERAKMEDQAVEGTRPYHNRHPRILCWVMTQPKNHAAR